MGKTHHKVPFGHNFLVATAIIFTIVAVIFVMRILLLAVGLNGVPFQNITDAVTYDIHHADGSVESHVPSSHLSIRYNDSIVYHVQLPAAWGAERHRFK